MRNINQKEQNRLKIYLQQIVEVSPFSLRAEVAKEAIESEDIQSFFSDLLTYGCESGMIGTLIYYHDTHQFYDRHYYDIETLREELESSFGEPLKIKGDLKNWYAWMAFEETARIIAYELELNV